MSTGEMWRLLFGRTRGEDAFLCGPWHADRAHVERWAGWFRAQGHEVQVQSNRQSRARRR